MVGKNKPLTLLNKLQEANLKKYVSFDERSEKHLET
jgi:hypothetical protein